MATMTDRYMQCTGQERDIPDGAVQDFLEEMDITMPKLTQDQQDRIGDDITRDEVKQALQKAKGKSALSIRTDRTNARLLQIHFSTDPLYLH